MLWRDWWKVVCAMKSPRDAKVFLALVGLAQEHRIIKANNRWIGAQCGLARCSVSRSLRNLRALGWIRWRRRIWRKGASVEKSTRYMWIHWSGFRASVMQMRQARRHKKGRSL
jgi:predicted transcriptional regulator